MADEIKMERQRSKQKKGAEAEDMILSKHVHDESGGGCLISPAIGIISPGKPMLNHDGTTDEEGDHK